MHKYFPLATSHYDSTTKAQRDPVKPGWQRKFWLLVGFIGGVIGICGLALLFARSLQYQSPTCGHTSAEARANGCQYEPMLRSWVPQDCYTDDLIQDYHPFDDRAWFFDKALTKPMLGDDLDILRDGGDIVAYTKSFHDEHCLYAWRKLHLAVEKRLDLVDTKTISLHHSTHCSQRIAAFIYAVNMWGYNQTLEHTSTAPIMFQTCVKLPWKAWL